MKALYFETTGMPEDVLKLGELPVPRPASGECLVRVLACSINPADFLFISGKYGIKPSFPQIAGMDGVGIVESSRNKIPQGSLVAFRHMNVWADYVVVPEGQLIPLPQEFPLEKAAQLFLNAGTAWGLLDRAKLKAGDWLLLTAGNSTIAKTVAQMAHGRGIKTIACVREASHAANLQDFRVSQIINTSETGEDLDQKILHITQGKGVSGFFDAVGGPVSSTLIKGMAAESTLIVYGLLSNETVCYHNSTILYKALKIEGFRIGQHVASLPDRSGTFQEIAGIVKSPEFRMDIGGKFPLSAYPEAIKSSRINAHNGKMIFWFAD